MLSSEVYVLSKYLRVKVYIYNVLKTILLNTAWSQNNNLFSLAEYWNCINIKMAEHEKKSKFERSIDMNKCTDMMIKTYFYRNFFNKRIAFDRIRNFWKTSVFFFVKVSWRIVSSILLLILLIMKDIYLLYNVLVFLTYFHTGNQRSMHVINL